MTRKLKKSANRSEPVHRQCPQKDARFLDGEGVGPAEQIHGSAEVVELDQAEDKGPGQRGEGDVGQQAFLAPGQGEIQQNHKNRRSGHGQVGRYDIEIVS